MTDPQTPVPAADLLVRRLTDYGVRCVFGYPGGQLTPIYDALYRQSAIHHILARHEQAAAFMADGYAHRTGRPGVCWRLRSRRLQRRHAAVGRITDSTPVLFISGQVSRPLDAACVRAITSERPGGRLRALTKAQGRADQRKQLFLFDGCWTELTRPAGAGSLRSFVGRAEDGDDGRPLATAAPARIASGACS